jgi:hypothetical protein
MALADDLKPIVDSIRAIPGEMGLRPYRVYLHRRVNDGGGLIGSRVDTDNEITVGSGQPPKVTQLSAEEMALGGYTKVSFRIGPFTPPYTGGGTNMRTLLADQIDDERAQVRLVGSEFPDGATFMIKRLAARLFARGAN